MSMTDPISDFLARIRNGIRARKQRVDCPRSNLKLRIAEILREEGFVDGVATAETEHKQGTISVTLRYDGRTGCAISGAIGNRLRSTWSAAMSKYMRTKPGPITSR